MKTRELERYKLTLSAKIGDLSQALRRRKLIAIEDTPEACERLVLRAQRELAVETLDRQSQLLKEVRAAMARIADGTYGVCETCDGEIHPKRLNAVPWARRCVPCQEGFDGGTHPAARSIPSLLLAA
jgi:DnaK suppressor protein